MCVKTKVNVTTDAKGRAKLMGINHQSCTKQYYYNERSYSFPYMITHQVLSFVENIVQKVLLTETLAGIHVVQNYTCDHKVCLLFNLFRNTKLLT